MDIFSEIYSCYYQVLDKILRAASDSSITKKDMMDIAKKYGFLESYIYIGEKILDDEWQVMYKTNDDRWKAKVNIKSHMPLTNLQKSWLKCCINDRRMRLFVREELLIKLEEYLKDIKPLYNEKDFYYIDQYSDGDNYDDPLYIDNFRKILTAIEKKRYIYVNYDSTSDKEIKMLVFPCKIEYSSKNNKMRLMCFYISRNNKRLYTLNISRIKSIDIVEYVTEKKDIDINDYIWTHYCEDPVHIIISNERNALERTMMYFANYEKSTTKLDDGTYSCKLYYNKNVETELLIDILSFGPMVRVVEPAKFLERLKERLKKQKFLDENIF